MKYPIYLIAAIVLAACSHSEDLPEEPEEFDPVTVASTQITTPDLKHYELVGPVKSSRRTTYYDIINEDNVLVVDTAGTNFIESVAYFDELGGYVSKKDERIRRDASGRITRWEDRHPNYSTIHPGFLKDTLAYEFITDDVVKVSGKRMETVVVTDKFGNIIGQQTHSLNPKYDTAATNIYRKYDKFGNWVERLTVWTTQTSGDSLPSVRYSIDHRKIVYYE